MTIPKEPRQQMINIMYLVLIALLAMNVSAEILNAFKMLRRGMDNSNGSISQKIENTIKSFEKKVDKEKRGEGFLTAAGEARTISAEFSQYIDDLDQQLLETVGEDEEHPGELKKGDDLDGTSKLFVEDGKKGYELEAKIKEYRDKFLNLFDVAKYKGLNATEKKAIEDAKVAMEQTLPLQIEEIDFSKSEKKDWPTYTFYQMPAEAARTLLTKFKNDAVSAEAAVIDKLYEQVGVETILFDTFEPAVIPNASRLIQGETFEADIYLAASSSMSRPRISAGGRTLKVDPKTGKAKYTAKASTVGPHTLTGTVTSKDGTGRDVTRKFTYKYEVVSPPDHVAIVSPTKMNVFYIGVDNPVSASITGMRNDAVNASMTGGTMSKASGAGNYTVRVTAPGKANITLSGKKKDGSTFTGTSEFRVLRIPDPVPEVGGKSGGKMGTGEMKAQTGVAAMLKDFVFDARFKVTGFEMTLAERGEDLLTCVNQGAKFGGQCASLINRAKVGSVYYFDNIKAVGPDQKTRKLPTIAFNIR